MKTSSKLKSATVLTMLTLSFLGGLQARQTPKIITKEVFVYVQQPTFLPFKGNKYAHEQQDKIAASIPASALQQVARR